MIDAFCILPGVGRKTAQRMVLNILERNRRGGKALSQAIISAVNRVGSCKHCRNHSESKVCVLCEDARRDDSLLCVVETPADVFAIEKSGIYRGYYFVLMGHLSPIDGIGPEELGIDLLIKKLQNNIVKEVVIATNSTVEGEATAYYIYDHACTVESLKISRIAHGVPLGGELEYIDGMTLSHAILGRKKW